MIIIHTVSGCMFMKVSWFQYKLSNVYPPHHPTSPTTQSPANTATTLQLAIRFRQLPNDTPLIQCYNLKLFRDTSSQYMDSEATLVVISIPQQYHQND